jgi:hypothetical protein
MSSPSFNIASKVKVWTALHWSSTKLMRSSRSAAGYGTATSDIKRAAYFLHLIAQENRMPANPLAPDPLTDIDGPALEEPDYNEPANGIDDEPEIEPEDEVPEEDPEDEPLAEPA